MTEKKSENEVRSSFSAYLIIAGFILLLLTGIAPVFLITGLVADNSDLLPLWQWAVLFFIGGGIVTLLITRSLRWLFCGAVFGSLSMLAYWIYFNVLFAARTTFIRIEFALPFVIAMFITILLAVLLGKISKTED